MERARKFFPTVIGGSLSLPRVLPNVSNRIDDTATYPAAFSHEWAEPV